MSVLFTTYSVSFKFLLLILSKLLHVHAETLCFDIIVESFIVLPQSLMLMAIILTLWYIATSVYNGFKLSHIIVLKQ